MRLNLFYIIIVFQMFGSNVLGQSIDDILHRGLIEIEEEVTSMEVDQDIISIIQEEIEKTKQDSIKQSDDNWRKYFSEVNESINRLLISIQEMDSSLMTREDIKKHKSALDDLDIKVKNKLENKDALWKNNAELDTMRDSFMQTYKRALLEIEEREHIISQPKPQSSSTNWWIVLGICFGVAMIIYPQLKAQLMIRKSKKQQEQQEQKIKEEEEKQRLLSQEEDITV